MQQNPHYLSTYITIVFTGTALTRAISYHLQLTESFHWAQMSRTTTIYKPSTAQRFSYFSNGWNLGMELTTKYACMRWICSVSSTEFAILMWTLFIYKESSYVDLKWFKLNIALVLLHQALWIVAEVYTPFTNDHADCRHDRMFGSAVT